MRRQVLAAAIPHIYKAIKANPVLLDFLSTIILKSKQSTAIVLIDFISNHIVELERDTNQPPILLSLLKLFCSRLSSFTNDEVVFKPYFKVWNPLFPHH